MAFVALFLLAKLALYCAFFFLLAKALQMGEPLDALRAGFHRTWLGGAGTLVSLVVYMSLRMSGSSPEFTARVGAALIWILRAAAWIWVLTWVYRVTRWRKGKLALSVGLGLALNFGVDYALAHFQGGGRSFMPSFGDWAFRLC